MVGAFSPGLPFVARFLHWTLVADFPFELEVEASYLLQDGGELVVLKVERVKIFESQAEIHAVPQPDNLGLIGVILEPFQKLLRKQAAHILVKPVLHEKLPEILIKASLLKSYPLRVKLSLLSTCSSLTNSPTSTALK